MLRLELVEENILSGDYGYGGAYGGSGALVLNDYLPERVAAQTGELWLSFINEPSKKPFKVADVAAGQKVQIPFVTDAPIRLYLVSHDPSGHRTTSLQNAVTKDLNVNRETKTPEIIKVGLATLDKVQIGIKNYSPDVRFRKIETADNPGFTINYHSQIKDYDGIVRILTSVETITRDYSSTPGTKYVRVSHSTNGQHYSPVSLALAVTFENESENGAPELFDPADPAHPYPITAYLDGDEFIVQIAEPFRNGAGVGDIQYRLYDKTNYAVLKSTLAGVPGGTTTAEVTNAGDFPQYSQCLLITAGMREVDAETMGYTTRDEANPYGVYRLYGLYRAIEHSQIREFSGTDLGVSTYIYPVFKQVSIGLAREIRVKRQVRSIKIQIRMRNGFRDGDSDGWSKWSVEIELPGTGDTSASPPTAPTPPPPVEATKPPGYEDSTDPANDKGRAQSYLDLTTV